MSRKIRREIAADWQEQLPIIEAARNQYGVSEFIDSDDADYEEVMKAARLRFASASSSLERANHRISHGYASPAVKYQKCQLLECMMNGHSNQRIVP